MIPQNTSLRPEAVTPDDLVLRHASGEEPPRKPEGSSTNPLKCVPEAQELREKIRTAAEQLMAGLEKTRLISHQTLETCGRQLLAERQLEEKYLGFTMVLLGNAFWKRQLLSVPYERRLLLLPQNLEHHQECSEEYPRFRRNGEAHGNTHREHCRACSLEDYKIRAEKLGYKVLAVEGTPTVLKPIVEGSVDGIVGIASLSVLEKAIDKILLTGVPSCAIPLHSDDSRNITHDEAWVWDVLEVYEPLSALSAPGYVPLMREARLLFEPAEFDRLLPPSRTAGPEQASSPLALTERIARDWLANGGKRFRPFITLAAYETCLGSVAATEPAGECSRQNLPDAVKKAAIAIEAFHKASLVHDDIQDGDLYRYGVETLHLQHGVGQAINIGDYLIGLGYRLLSECHREGDAGAVGDIVSRMAFAHLKLCEGQGAEMAWTNAPSLELTVLDAMQIYALKTSPAFEAALYSGLRLAGDVTPYADMIPVFCRHLGVGFQILNDLKDWQGDAGNKVITGQDAMALRPTLLLALAIQKADAGQKKILRKILVDNPDSTQKRLELLRQIFEQTAVFEQAEQLVEKSRERAEALADATQPETLRQFLHFLIETVLAPEATSTESLPKETLVPLSG